MIENIQRDDLRAPEIATFIADRLDAGDTQADISRKLGKPRDWVSRYASVQSMPEFLRARLEDSSIRALYELYQAWRTHPDEIERLCATQDSFTDAQARQLARDVRAEADRANAQDESPAGPPQSEQMRPPAGSSFLPRTAPKAEKQQPMINRQKLASFHNPGRQHRWQSGFDIRTGPDSWLLIGSRRKAPVTLWCWSMVRSSAEEVPASALTIEEILSR